MSASFDQRRKAIQRAAVDVIRRKGVRGMTFTEVAGQLDIVPSAIGYYFRRKEDLVVACLLESIATFDAFTAEAAHADDAPGWVRRYFAKLLQFWAAVMSGDADPVVLFNEVRTIKDADVDAAYMRMYRGMRRRLDLAPPLGRLERNARAHQFLTQVLWVTLWTQRYDPRDLERLAVRIADLLVHGLAAPDRHWTPARLASVGRAGAAAGDLFLNAAVELINEDGYRGASVEKIAARLNLSKGAFYHHHEAKDDLVVAGFRRTLATIREAQDRADAVGRDGLERLCLATAELFRGHLAGDAPLLRISALAAVSEEIGHDIFEDFSRVSLHFAGIVSDGIADGSLRPVDSNVAGFMVTAMISGSINWPIGRLASRHLRRRPLSSVPWWRGCSVRRCPSSKRLAQRARPAPASSCTVLGARRRDSSVGCRAGVQLPAGPLGGRPLAGSNCRRMRW